MSADVYWVSASWPGRIGIVPRPRGGDWLDEEIQVWAEAGVGMVVSMLTPEEVDELDLGQEMSACERHGIKFRVVPVPDRGVPPSRQEFTRLVQQIEQNLQAGTSIAVHCRQGIGRSAVVVAAVLAYAGEDVDAAFARVTKARGRPVPDTEEQRQWLRKYVQSATVPAVAALTAKHGLAH